ncbi:hypothetical protein INS49_014077 [Diaporthe citri]|uniref:uncharacterized protein n=1 Tax=Diaporthe citri TaxID=83186 RepID=UPI001C81AC22|nr:uncharacterized protein INS49_014077 [Diaporthe citri]KAG6358193.1 hypothetical protein INS49_014077 [Diaporthe citri]
MANFEAPANNEYQLQGRILQLIPSESQQEVEENGELRAIRDHCIAGEEVAQALINEILDGIAKAESKLERARQAAEEISGTLRGAGSRKSIQSQHAKNTWARYEALQRQQNEHIAHWQHAAYREQYQGLGEARLALMQAQEAFKEAQYVVEQLEAESRQARAMCDKCRNEEHSRQILGEVAISAVLEKQSRRSNGAWEKIQVSLPV